MTGGKNQEVSQRQLRVGEQIRHILSQSLRKPLYCKDYEIEAGSVTVTEVRISPDLKHAKAYVMSIAGNDIEELTEALNTIAGTFQRDINDKTNLKFTPRIRFVSDKSLEHVNRIEEILKNIPKPIE